jgi:3-hydroxybutyryl-CoA dehydratase
LFYEDFQIKALQKTWGRTVTEADIVIFAGLTGAVNPLFLDEEYSKNTTFGHRIAPGLLTLSIATGLTYQLPSSPFGEGFVALMGMNFKASRPVFVGDTLRVDVTVKDKLGTKNGRGTVVLESIVTNQKGEIVMSVEGMFLVRVRG